MINNNYNSACKDLKCPEYIEWEYEGQALVSCKKIGQTDNIDEYPSNCNFIDIIRNVEISSE